MVVPVYNILPLLTHPNRLCLSLVFLDSGFPGRSRDLGIYRYQYSGLT